MTGYINKLDSFATLDGGGIRYCVFMQGCPLSCVYCHNADTKLCYQAMSGERKNSIICLDSKELASKIIRNKVYYKKGGVTFSGGEPLLQSAFVLETTKILKSENIHVAIDTSGVIINSDVLELIGVADLFIVDLKFAENEGYERYTGGKGLFDKVMEFIRLCLDAKKNIILRTVIVPTINDSEEKLEKYKKVVSGLNLINSWELLPFHTLGFSRYEEIGEVNHLVNLDGLNLAVLDKLVEYIKS